MFEFNSAITGDGLGRTDPFCAPENTSAGIILYVFDSTHRPVTAIHWYVNDLKNPMTKKRFDSLILAHKENYLKRAVILKEWEISNFEQKIDLHEFQLKKGRYFIQLLYFAGRRITNFVSEDQILNDKSLFNADVYQGCVISNKSLLIVD